MNILYPYLPEGREIKYVDLNNQYMQKAKEEAQKSKELNQPTGAVAVLGLAVISAACNKPPITNKKLAESHKKFWCLRRLLRIKSGKMYWLCPGCAGYGNHAESRVAKQAAQKGFHDFDLYLYGHWWCCKPCWDSMIQAGVRDVYLLEGSDVLFNPKKEGNILRK